jgi:hypothetical protein
MTSLTAVAKPEGEGTIPEHGFNLAWFHVGTLVLIGYRSVPRLCAVNNNGSVNMLNRSCLPNLNVAAFQSLAS